MSGLAFSQGSLLSWRFFQVIFCVVFATLPGYFSDCLSHPFWPCWNLFVLLCIGSRTCTWDALGSPPKPRKIHDREFSRPGFERSVSSSPQIPLTFPFPKTLLKAVIPRSADTNWKKSRAVVFPRSVTFYTSTEGSCELAFLHLVLRGH